MASFLSDSRQQRTLVKCWKMVNFFEKLILVAKLCSSYDVHISKMV